MSTIKALSREEIIRVIEGKGIASRVPCILQFWSSASVFGENEADVQQFMDKYEQDVDIFRLNTPKIYEAPEDDPTYRWLYYDADEVQNEALDAKSGIKDWSNIDEILERFPNPDYVNLIPSESKEIHGKKYKVYTWWYSLFERHWELRGMENALTDYYLYPDEVHKFLRTLTDFYKRIIERVAKEAHADAVLISDDIGTQTGPFFSLDIFREFFKPYYKELIQVAHDNNMHLWLHACGNIESFLEDFIEIGLDVIHPIQKHTMDEKVISEKYGDRICIWAGFDVQQVIPYQTAEDVRTEVRFMMDTYFNKNGRFMITCGNGITGDCPVDSIKALYSECYEYGRQKVIEKRK